MRPAQAEGVPLVWMKQSTATFGHDTFYLLQSLQVGTTELQGPLYYGGDVGYVSKLAAFN